MDCQKFGIPKKTCTLTVWPGWLLATSGMFNTVLGSLPVKPASRLDASLRRSDDAHHWLSSNHYARLLGCDSGSTPCVRHSTGQRGIIELLAVSSRDSRILRMLFDNRIYGSKDIGSFLLPW